MTTAIKEKKIYRCSVHGDYYIIPESMNLRFIQMNEEMSEADFDSDAWINSCARFNKVFDEYLE